MSGVDIRAMAAEVPSGTEALREIRFLDDSAFDALTLDELGSMQRWLWAARWSATEGARKVARVMAARPDFEGSEWARVPIIGGGHEVGG